MAVVKLVIDRCVDIVQTKIINYFGMFVTYPQTIHVVYSLAG